MAELQVLLVVLSDNLLPTRTDTAGYLKEKSLRFFSKED